MKTSSFKAQDLLKAKTLAPALFVGMGVYKTCKDYKKADEKHKEKILIKDTVILSASALGYAASYTLIKHCPNIKIVDKALKPSGKAAHAVNSSLNHIEEAVKECLKAGFITLGSIAAALGANEIVHKYLFKKPKTETKADTKADTKAVNIAGKETGVKRSRNEKFDEADTAVPEKQFSDKEAQKNTETGADKNAFEKFIVKTKSNDYVQVINSEFSKDPANKVFASFSFLSVMRVLDFPMTVVAGFDISKEKDMEERVKRTSYSLIANIFVPTFIVSIVSALTKRMKNVIKIPVLAAATMTGIAIGTVLGKAAEKKIEENLHLK